MAGASPKLARIEAELADARRRAHAIGDALSEALWSTRPAPTDWSVGECLVHLNLTSRAFVPLIERAIADARSGTPSAAPSYRMDAVGRLLWLMTALRIPVKTTDPFVSPFDARLRYNLYSAFRLIAAHQRLHCRQAEQALRTVRASLMDRR